MNLIQTEPPVAASDAFMRLVCSHLRRRIGTVEDSPSETTWPADIDYIRQCTEAAVSALDGPRNTIRRALFDQEWSLFLNGFPPVIEIPLSPVQSILSIKYLDEDGAWQTLDSSKYRLTASHTWQPEISPIQGEEWPSTMAIAESVEVSFKAGFGPSHTNIPNAILQAVLELAAHFYMERQIVAFGTPTELPFGVKRLLNPYRVFR
ncbi:MAG: hypothetical protein R3D70_12120 [Rhizobiaceae bacterium]